MHSNKNVTLPQSSPALSVIVPILNEAVLLPQLFATLNRQIGIDFELILVDGGSHDNSIASAQQLATSAPFPCHVQQTHQGRACQMNCGAAMANGAYLLFLHADSTFVQATALQSGVAGLIAAEKNPLGPAVAARFRLNFAGNEKAPRLWRDFHTQKAHLNRRGCIHGDQGFLLSRSFFSRIGPLDETLPFLEDDHLSDRIFTHGRWILLPVEIITSTRRFAAEGYWQRDVLNMMIMALYQSGHADWLSGLHEAYKATPKQENVPIAPMITHIKTKLQSLSCKERMRFLLAIGRSLQKNIWQIKLMIMSLSRAIWK